MSMSHETNARLSFQPTGAKVAARRHSQNGSQFASNGTSAAENPGVNAAVRREEFLIPLMQSTTPQHSQCWKIGRITHCMQIAHTPAAPVLGNFVLLPFSEVEFSLGSKLPLFHAKQGLENSPSPVAIPRSQSGSDRLGRIFLPPASERPQHQIPDRLGRLVTRLRLNRDL
jgi:hypothetical protein